MMYFERGSTTDILKEKDLQEGIIIALEKIGERKRVLVIPPDFTRFHSRAGELTTYAYQYYQKKITDILPALGTHVEMTDKEIEIMYTGVPKDLFRVHDWRNDVVTAGNISGKVISEITNGGLDFDFPIQLNKLLWDGNHDLILSIGQVVPHEVLGFANHTKNILVGTGGVDGINKSHFVSAAYGMEKVMGRVDNPIRRLLSTGADEFIGKLPIVYIHTVIARDDKSGKLVTRGLFIGDDYDVFTKAAELSLKVNFIMLDRPIKKAVVYLDPSEFKSTWLGNKSIYRTRMAMANDGELVVLAPALKEFGEDKEIDRLIRKYGYFGTPATLKSLKENKDLENNLSAAAHLIHGSSEDRFSITYCPGHLTKEEIESVNFKYADLNKMIKKYNPEKLKEGYNTMPNGEEIFFISNPAIGLWAYKDRFK